MLNQDVNQYQECGYYVKSGLFQREECDQLNQAMEQLAKRGLLHDDKKETDDFQEDTSAAYQNILCYHHPHVLDEVIKSAMCSPRVAAILGRVIGPSVKAVQSMMFVKAPGLQGQAWHQDEIYIPTRDRSLTGVWIALDDATIENGCLWVIEGSHRLGYLHPMKHHDQLDEFDFAECAYGFDESAEVPVELKKGDVLFFNGYLLHRSKKNRSKTSYRRSLVCHYMNSYSLLPWGEVARGSSSYSGGFDNRNIIQVLGEDPYAWKGSTQEGVKPHCRKYEASLV